MKVKYNFTISLMFLMAGYVNITRADSLDEAPIYPVCEGVHGAKLESKVFAIPGVGAEAVADIGQTMISTYRTDLMEGVVSYEFSLDQSVKLSGRSYGQDFTLTVFPLKTAMIQGASYRLAEYNFQYLNDKEPRTGFNKPDVYLMMSLPSREVMAKVKIGFGEEKISAGTARLLKTPRCIVNGPESFQKELVYTGVAKGVISILYRELIGNMIRPAFSQEFHFDLNEGNEIGFKGARFNVIKANNLGITYQVTKNLD